MNSELPMKPAVQPPAEKTVPISPDATANKQSIEKVLANCSDAVFLHWRYGPERQYEAWGVYFITLVEKKKINHIISAMQEMFGNQTGLAANISPDDVLSFLDKRGVLDKPAQVLGDLEQAVQNIMSGHVVLLFHQWDKALGIHALTRETRQVTEPTGEPVVKGPREGTIEDLHKNMGMIRVRLKTPDLKIVFLSGGGKSNTELSYGYVEGAVNPETLTLFKERISAVKETEILETAYVEELIEDEVYSPFPQCRYTERPDVVAASLLDGKIFVAVSGSPSIMICPGLFPEFLQSPEDYYERTVFSSLIRLLRLAAFIMSLILPSGYIALTTFHPELIPSVLLLAILNTREGIPFPALVEAMLMVFFFEVLREAGVRLPRPVGPAVSIVGALVIGEAAFRAGIASPIMVVVIAVTGIANFSIPQFSLAISLRILTFPLMLLAATLGGFGLMVGFLLILLHMMNLRCLGQPYMAPLGPLRLRQWRDVVLRAPLVKLLETRRNRNEHAPP